jgi:hypothetical protein
MKRNFVRYKTKPEKADENARLIERTFEELRAKAPQDVRYLALRLADGTFVHFSVSDTADGKSPIPTLDAFRAFQAEHQGPLCGTAAIERRDYRRQLSDACRVMRARTSAP